MKLSTLRQYINAIGGQLHLLVTFPEGEAVQLKDIGDSTAQSQPKAAKRRSMTRV